MEINTEDLMDYAADLIGLDSLGDVKLGKNAEKALKRAAKELSKLVTGYEDTHPEESQKPEASSDEPIMATEEDERGLNELLSGIPELEDDIDPLYDTRTPQDYDDIMKMEADEAWADFMDT